MHVLLPEDIANALEILSSGGVIVFPTETSYGLGCDATNAQAVQKIFRIKERDSSKALPVLLPSLESLSSFVLFSQKAFELAQRYWPGPLNIVAPLAQASTIAKACSHDGMQSVRVSSHPFAQALAYAFGKPLVATSANISGEAPIFSFEEAKRIFEHAPFAPDAIVDGGSLSESPASTTVRVVGDVAKIIRQGAIQI